MSQEALIDMAKQMAGTRGHACPKDIDIIVDIMKRLPEDAVVVQLGAGSGTMTLAILGACPKARMWSVDTNHESLHWEQVALDNTGAEGSRTPILAPSREAGEAWEGPKLDLLLVDADHTYEGVLADLKAWEPHLAPTAFVFAHDYDGSYAPAQYPGVKQACDEFFANPPNIVDGWSAVFQVGQHAAQPLKKPEKGPRTKPKAKKAAK